eukprot:8008532-Pyramimonas_sp.AAC.1
MDREVYESFLKYGREHHRSLHYIVILFTVVPEGSVLKQSRSTEYRSTENLRVLSRSWGEKIALVAASRRLKAILVDHA